MIFLLAAEKMEEKEAIAILELLEIKEDEDGMIKYMGELYRHYRQC